MSILHKRVWTEFNKLKGLYNDSTIKFLIDSSPFDIEEESTIDFIFIGRIFPTSNPFNQSAFKIEIKLTKLYPAKPPEVRILTPIHHPNVTERGIVCLTILNATESWKPSLFLTDVLKELLIIIDHPNLNIPVNDDIANEYLYNKNEYDRKALAMVQTHKTTSRLILMIWLFVRFILYK